MINKSRHYCVYCYNFNIVIINRGIKLDKLGFDPQLSLTYCMTWAYYLPFLSQI